MNFDLLIPLLVTTTLAIVGWFAGHHFTSKRDRENKQRDIRITYLVQAYRDLGMAASRSPNSEPFKERIAGSGLALQQPSLTQHSSGAAQKAAQPAWLYVGLLMP